jgi:hypothetical protein
MVAMAIIKPLTVNVYFGLCTISLTISSIFVVLISTRLWLSILPPMGRSTHLPLPIFNPVCAALPPRFTALIQASTTQRTPALVCPLSLSGCLHYSSCHGFLQYPDQVDYLLKIRCLHGVSPQSCYLSQPTTGFHHMLDYSIQFYILSQHMFNHMYTSL